MTLASKYEQAMAHLTVDGAMRERVLRSVRTADLEKTHRVVAFPWRRYAALAACLAVVIAGALLLPGLLRGQPSDTTSGPVLTGPSTEQYDSAAALSAAIGFPVKDVAGLPFEPAGTVYLASWGELAEIDYTGADGQTAIYRKSAGTDDNSGHYETFDSVKTLTAGKLTAALKGSGGVYTLAVWTDGAYACSLELEPGLSADQWTALLNENQ
jgi:hypothetical protein